MTPTMPCPYLAGGGLCARSAGHPGRHEPQVPEISARRLQRLRDRFYGRAWWQARPRCPRCRTVVEGFTRGEMTGPVVVPTGQGTGPCAEVISEYPVTLAPCGHQFRRIMRAKDYR